MLESAPSALEMFSYTFSHFSASLALFYEFKDYIHFIELSHEYEDLKPSSLLGPSISLYLLSLIFAAVYSVLSKDFSGSF